MITQEDLFIFFEKMAQELRDENIPILNNLGENEAFPNIKYRDEVRAEENIQDDSDEEIIENL